MLELTTVNGFRRMVRLDQITQIAELPDSKRSSTVVSLEMVKQFLRQTTITKLSKCMKCTL